MEILTRKQWIWIISLTSALLLSCVTQNIASDDDLEVAPAQGKTDGLADTVAISKVNEPLYSATLKTLICQALPKQMVWSVPSGGACEDAMTFTVTEKISSQLYAYQGSGDAITVGLTVNVTLDSMQQFVQLKRMLRGDYRLDWEALIDKTNGSGDVEFISKMAEEIGEYFDPFETKWGAYIELTTYAQIPQSVSNAAQKYIQDYDTQDNQGTAELTDDNGPYRIVRNGNVIGYVVLITYWIDQPYFDGAGAALYFDNNGKLLTYTEWEA